ncbi:ATP-dependent Clp protease adaptor ClpS [Methylobrevis pamukkalensis]|uniref:ATP-dependent Clp protease adapter protein ClpS n=1 Tax=Methylobrevis pamukkalensis TaxID=1439726 RepID=A0A1E3H203_9HYPH|nr:ATP-dependent Clp protease adaptor ClpS [Methylobrevis pamukkalensis]ODN70342.1 ATP-dependent Clp protease adapter protein ClpS [Methylobrevis pamukkalensis]
MRDTTIDRGTKTSLKLGRPQLHKVILHNDDFTPREFVMLVLAAVFRLGEDDSYRIMMTAHKLGACVIAVYAQDIAETKASEAGDLAREAGFALLFTTEPDE